VFLTAASPGVAALFFRKEYYPSREAYFQAIAEALRAEYRAIVDAGFVLQVDCPDLAMGRHIQFGDASLEEGIAGEPLLPRHSHQWAGATIRATTQPAPRPTWRILRRPIRYTKPWRMA
jgi:methionine synthase II (cobalamin-independent)